MENGKLNGFNDGLHPSSGIGGGQSAAEMMAEEHEKVMFENERQKMFVPYDLACLLKTKGFNLLCKYSYYQDGTVGSEVGWINYNQSETLVSRPMYQQVVDWFRLKHKYVLSVFQETDFGIETNKNPTYTGKWNWEIVRLGKFEPAYDCQFGVADEYYKGWYEIVKMALTLIPNKK
jgi:hypothetical protein